jgi:basic membrane protein A and related proteins
VRLKKPVAVILAMVVVMLFIPACGASPPDDNAHRIVMLFDSPVANDSFSLGCLNGAEQAKAQFDLQLSVSIASSDTEAESWLSRISSSRGNDLIICVGASHTRALRKMAVKYPKQKFALVDGDIQDLLNVTSLLVRDNESSYLVGALAAMVSKSNHIGFIGGRDEPSIQRFLAGYRAGARDIKPECQVSVDFAGSWLNDGKTKLLAVQQIVKGADVLFGPAGAGSLGVIEAAQEQGCYAIGVDADQSALAPGAVLVSAVKHINIPVYQSIRSVVQDQFKSGIQSSGLKEGAVEAKINPSIAVITPAMLSALTALQNKIISGEISVPEN